MTDREIRMIWRNKAFDSLKQVRVLAELENCNYHVMFDRLVKLGLVSESERTNKAHHGKAWGADETAELVRMYQKGMSYNEMAEILGRTKDSISQRLYTVGAK